jgi:multiple sugar transport system permease protein
MHLIVRVVLHVIAVLGAIPFILPFMWMLRTAVMPLWQIHIFPPVWWPAEFNWQNFYEPWATLPFAIFYKNTIVLTALKMSGVLLSCSLVAYGFARLRFPGRGILFMLVLSTMMLPYQVTLIPKYVLFTKLGWANTINPMVVPAWLAGNPFTIFMMRQFMLTISPEIEDAAKIDGCGYFGTFWRIVLPLSRPALGVACIFQFLWSWNDFFEPLLYLNSTDKYTVTLGLAWLQKQGHIGVRMNAVVGPLMAQSLIFLVPVLIVFYLTQKYMVQGIVLTGLR